MTQPPQMYISDSGLTAIPVTQPVAGAEWSYLFTTPGELVAVYAVLATSAVVASRTPVLIIDNGGAMPFYNLRWGSLTEAASTTNLHNAINSGTALGSVNSTHVSPLPRNLRLNTGWRIRTLTGSIDVGDQWSQITLLVAQ